MKARWMLFVSLLATALLASSGSQAASWYYVDATNGNDTTGDGSSANPWRTIARANQVPPVSGDIVWIHGGPVTYPEQISPPGPGITYRGLGSSPPVLVPMPNCVPPSCLPDCIRIGVGRDNTTVKRITCQGPPLGSSDPDFGQYAIIGGSGVTIEDSQFLGGNGWHGISLQPSGSGNRLLRNLIWPNTPISGDPYNCVNPLDSCGATAITIQGRYNLIEKNTVLDGGHDCIQIQASFNVIRGNTFTNPNWRQIGIISTNMAVDPAEHNVIEGNVVTGSLYSPEGPNAFQLISRKTIVRFNRFYDNTGPGLRISRDSSPVPAQDDLSDNRVYHNVFYENGQDGNWTTGFSLGIHSQPPPNFAVAGNLLLNNIFLLNDPPPGEPAGEPSGLQLRFIGAWSSGLNGTVIRQNNILDADAGDPVIKVQNPPACEGGGAGPTSEASLAVFQSCYPSLISGNLEVDPLFVDPASGDFSILSGSPMKNAGGFLTYTRTAGSGTLIPVYDALGFSDGFGVVPGDLIRITGSTATARIIDVDYDEDNPDPEPTLTVDAPLSWSALAGVHLNFKQGAPDIGVHEVGQATCGLGGEPLLLVALLAAVRTRRRIGAR